MPGEHPFQTTETMLATDGRPGDTDPPPFARMARLACVVGDDAGQTFPIRGVRTVIGRGGDAEIPLRGAEISRLHAEIERNGDDFVLRDLGSRNGTTVNGLTARAHTLHPGDRIQLGAGTILVFALHDELVQQALRLEKLEGLATVTGGIVHDFKNTLGVILANAELLERELASLPGDSEARAMLGDIATAARSGLDSARRLLYFANREGDTAWTDVNVTELIEGVLGLLRRPLLAQQIAIDLEIGPCFSLSGDRDQLHHALLNLVVNARDAMPSGGRLTVSAVGRTFARAESLPLHLPFPGAYVEIAVADTGIGMDEKTQARVFEPFFTTKPAGEGSGLGLPTVYGIIRNHGGNVMVESTPGHGTRMRLLLPGRIRTP